MSYLRINSYWYGCHVLHGSWETILNCDRQKVADLLCTIALFYLDNFYPLDISMQWKYETRMQGRIQIQFHFHHSVVKDGFGLLFSSSIVAGEEIPWNWIFPFWKPEIQLFLFRRFFSNGKKGLNSAPNSRKIRLPEQLLLLRFLATKTLIWFCSFTKVTGDGDLILLSFLPELSERTLFAEHFPPKKQESKTLIRKSVPVSFPVLTS